MPSKNTVRTYDAPAYYHIYNRGAGKQAIFLDDADRRKFMSLFYRYLDPDDKSIRSDGFEYEKYALEIIAYCLMPNHFHICIFQPSDRTALMKFMKSISTAYTMYFNLKYNQSGHLFQGPFKAAHITEEDYLMHITRYIHMNPRRYLRYKWSSIGSYLGQDSPVWLHPERINPLIPQEYHAFLEEYEGKKAEMERLKNSIVASQV